MAGRRLFNAHRQDVHLCFGCAPDFVRRSVGYVGHSDGWQDVMLHRDMRWEFESANDGNIALTGEVDLSQDLAFTLGVGFGPNHQSAVAKLLQSFAQPFDEHRSAFVKRWQGAVLNDDSLREHTGDDGVLLRLSRSVLLAHEDKSFQGAIIASMSIPWGETRGDEDLGGYHVVWTRDLVHSATGLLASGQTHTPLRALIWLASIQPEDGHLPQNSWIDGRPAWTGRQLDEVAAPVLLAWRLRREGALAGFDPWVLVMRAARYVVLNGPVTQQERWEENAGYSPSTLAWAIGALVCAADFAKDRREDGLARFLLEHADWVSANVDRLTVTSRGDLMDGKPRHYVRITPTDADTPDPHVSPDDALLVVANGGGSWPARNVVGGDFLELVRLGIRDPLDPLVRDSLDVIDHVLRHELPQGVSWRRYNHDGYGQKDDGQAFDSTGVGRCWPLLTGERGHYEVAAGNDALPFIVAMEQLANDGGMLPEQVWDGPARDGLAPGGSTGSAMPLCWAHSEYLELVRSRRDGVCYSRIEPAYERYVKTTNSCDLEVWTLTHRIRRLAIGSRLRLVVGEATTVTWSTSVGADGGTLEAGMLTPQLGHVDLPTQSLNVGVRVLFTIRATAQEPRDDRQYDVIVCERA
jgi:glucoamylase